MISGFFRTDHPALLFDCRSDGSAEGNEGYCSSHLPHVIQDFINLLEQVQAQCIPRLAQLPITQLLTGSFLGYFS